MCNQSQIKKQNKLNVGMGMYWVCVGYVLSVWEIWVWEIVRFG